MARADRIPFLPGQRLITVHGVVNRTQRLVFLVDSGAVRTAISRRAASALGIDLGHPLRFEPLVGVGRTAPLPVVRLDLVQVGANDVGGLIVSVFDLPSTFNADGLLGVDFLRRFRVTLEFDTRTLILRDLPAPRQRSVR
jgi:predicted aspartyl protease